MKLYYEKAVVKPCTCKHASQDLMYGLGNRVHNEGKKNASTTYKCSVCGNKKEK